MIKIDKRRTYRIMLDVETTMCPTNQQIIFDLGFAVFNSKGEIMEQYSLVIEEVFCDMDLMQKAYYFKKYPLYLKGLGTKFHMVKWGEAKALLQMVIEKYSVKEVLAYNLAFDNRAINETEKFINGVEYTGFDNVKLYDLMGMAIDTLGQHKSYEKFCLKHNLQTDKGNLKSSAESIYAYMTNNPTFEEEHTGLEDVKIEIAIWHRVYRQKKKMHRNLVGASKWNKIPYNSPKAKKERQAK